MKKIVLAFLFIASSLYSQPPGFSLANGFGSPGAEISKAIAQDNQGNIYITGSFEGTVDVDPSPTVFNLVSNGGTDGFVAKYDAGGNLVYAFSFGSANSAESGMDICITPSGNTVLVTGMFRGTVDFDPSTSVLNLNSAGGADIFISSYSATSGALLNAFSAGGSSNDEAIKIAADNAGNIIVTGFFEGTADFDPTMSTSALGSLSPLGDCFIAKYSSTGSLSWAKAIGGAGHDEGKALAIDNSNNAIYLAGTFNSYALVNSATPSHTLTAKGGNDCFISKCSSNGVFQWAYSVGGASDDACGDICTDFLGNLYAVGSFSGNGYFNPSVTAPVINAGTEMDIFLASYSGAGNFQWAKNIGNNAFPCQANSVASDANNNIIVTGAFAGPTDFDASANSYPLNAGNNLGIFVAKYNSAGGFLWAFNPQGSSNSTGFGVAVSPADQVYITGALRDTVDFDFTAGTQTVNFSANTDDAFFARYNQMPCSPPPTPTNVTSASNSTFCANTPGTLVVNGAGNISWFTSAMGGSAFAYGDTLLLNQQAAGTYTLYAEANTCATSISREQVTVSVMPQPTVTAINSGSICTGESATLTATGANTYSWNVSLTGNQIIVSPSLTTSYSVTGTNTVGCSNTAATTVTVETCAGIRELFSESNIKVYPNPSAGKIYIDCNDSESLIEVYDALSKLVLKQTLQKGTTSIEKLPRGIIFLRLTSHSQTVTKRIIVR